MTCRRSFALRFEGRPCAITSVLVMNHLVRGEMETVSTSSDRRTRSYGVLSQASPSDSEIASICRFCLFQTTQRLRTNGRSPILYTGNSTDIGLRNETNGWTPSETGRLLRVKPKRDESGSRRSTHARQQFSRHSSTVIIFQADNGDTCMSAHDKRSRLPTARHDCTKRSRLVLAYDVMGLAHGSTPHPAL